MINDVIIVIIIIKIILLLLLLYLLLLLLLSFKNSGTDLCNTVSVNARKLCT